MNLFVGNLNPDTSDIDLRKIFSEFGEVVAAKIVKDNITGDSRGFGFVEMADKFHSYDAIDNLDGTYLQGNIISVKEAKQKTSDRPVPRRTRTFIPRGTRPDRGERPDREDRFNKRF